MKLPTPSNRLCIPEMFHFQENMKPKRHAFTMTSVWIMIFGMVFFAPAPGEGSAANIPQPAFKSHIMIRLNSEKTDANPSESFPPIYFRSILMNFYEKRNFSPLWTLDDDLTPQAAQLVRAIEEADLDGLIPEDYHLSRLKSLSVDIKQALLLRRSFDPQKQAELDILLTDAFLLFSSHLLSGRVIPGTVDSTWLFFNPVSDIAQILNSDASSRVESFFDGLRPAHAAYYRLRNALQHYTGIQKKGGWPTVPEGPNLRFGDVHDRVENIRKRLIATEDVNPPALCVNRAEFDESLMKGVQRFQARHGIEPDGVVGIKTLTTMNVPVEDRIRQIALNLERWRWIPHNLGSRYILVNIADYSLAVVENQTTVLEMRVVVGKAYRRTPVFSDKMRYLVLNPFWNIPVKIAVEDKLPIIRKNPLYLTQQQIKVFENWSEDASEINPVIINWSRVNSNYFPYRLRQDPGPSNALGRIKFMFPNKFSVYLHDTPQRSLFKKASRDFSSGCIRIEKPIELATYLLQNDPQWPDQKIMETIESGVTTVVRFKNPIPVHLLYWTAWVTETGDVHFGNDIYDRDPPLSRALKAKLNDKPHSISAENPPGLKAEN
jgi:murein L,D-transpeptidase YcbB/YkuD